MQPRDDAGTQPRMRWSSGADALGNADGHTNLLYFDLDIKRLLPRKLSMAQGSEPRGSATVDHDRLNRRELWAKHGRPMHFLTLEFADAAVEIEFQKDATRRAKRWVKYMVGLNALFNFSLAFARCFQAKPASVNQKEIGFFWRNLDTVIATLLYVSQLAQMYLDQGFVLRNFQELLLLWSLMQSCGALYWATQADYIDGTEKEESILAMLVMTLFAYRGMRFAYFLVFALATVCGYFVLVCSSLAQNDLLLLISAGLVFLSWTMEVVQRRDFVQASASWREHMRSDLLLHNILPAPIVTTLKEQSGAISQSYDMATVFFADVVSFTTMSAQISPSALVELLNRMFRRIDQLAERNGVEKVKTIGDCYMAAAGLPVLNPMHAQTMARFSLQMLAMMNKGDLKNPATGDPIRVRIGIHSGPCVAGVIGHKKFAYDIWGDAVNTASRMESHGEPMRVHCSGDTYELLQHDFECEAREAMNVKGKGLMQTYFVIAEKPAARHRSFLPQELAEANGADRVLTVDEARG